ncbi:gluconate kinase, partial [Bifidobacterium adolescentis]
IGKITDLSEAIEKVQLASQVPVQQTVKETYQKIFPIFVETQKQVAATYQPLAHLRQTLSTMNEK